MKEAILQPKERCDERILQAKREAFVCMFYGCASHLDGFCFWRRRIEKRHFEYARNSYHDKFFDLLHHFYSHVTPHSYSCASPRTFSRDLSCFSHGPNHCSYGFGLRENRFKPRLFGYGPRPHCGDHFPRMPNFSTLGFHTRFEPRHLDGPRFLRHGSRPTHLNGEVQKIVKTSSSRMVKCWISKIYLTNPTTEPSTFSHPM
jgi:hypothetical protein